ncbi:hypothetical protein KGF56_003401 [Candida oxycetoniae]|uniref:Opaque-phase-specific protein OP4 n=1 Tax=Candida oxycetoniae TaxID=497107 RepID=A0AAI9SW25_9ASCO|nr:uncharacterized protein KGF56_003401 [Candida oxycetoniae]KAI3403766.1 hypothetical protein KGF56_003401 [Candida oxycetoniae]
MKFSQATLLAILASSAFVSAAPAPAIISEQTMVKREDINEVLAILSELQNHNAKREFLSGDELIEHDKRSDSVLGDLITALTNSGIIGDIWHILTTDEAISSSIKAIIQSAIQTAVVQGPALIKAIWNSGLLGSIFNSFLNDADLRNAFLNVAKSIFGTAVNLITSWLSGSSSSSTAAATPATTAAKRDVILDGEYMDKRDLASILSFIVTQIKDSGIVSSLINKVLADPQATINFLTTAFQTGLVVAQEIYGWAKSSGLWDSALSYIEANAGTWAGAIASFLGNALTKGLVSASEIDNATGSSAASTSTVSTRDVAAAAAPASTTAKAVTTTTTAAVTAAAAGNTNALDSLINQYGTATATAPTVDTGNLANNLNQLVGAANSAAASLKRRNY